MVCTNFRGTLDSHPDRHTQKGYTYGGSIFDIGLSKIWGIRLLPFATFRIRVVREKHRQKFHEVLALWSLLAFLSQWSTTSTGWIGDCSNTEITLATGSNILCLNTSKLLTWNNMEYNSLKSIFEEETTEQPYNSVLNLQSCFCLYYY